MSADTTFLNEPCQRLGITVDDFVTEIKAGSTLEEICLAMEPDEDIRTLGSDFSTVYDFLYNSYARRYDWFLSGINAIREETGLSDLTVENQFY